MSGGIKVVFYDCIAMAFFVGFIGMGSWHGTIMGYGMPLNGGDNFAALGR